MAIASQTHLGFTDKSDLNHHTSSLLELITNRNFILGHPVEGILNNKQKKTKFFVWPIAYILILDISCLTRINFWGFHIFLLNTKQRAIKSTNSSLLGIFGQNEENEPYGIVH